AHFSTGFPLDFLDADACNWANDILRPRNVDVIVSRTCISFHLSKGKRNPPTKTTLKTLDSDSWKCDSQSAKTLRRASTTATLRGPFSFAA
ncbi:MAG: hypothetical protein J0H18_00005, partial [Rhizobiales bacterium]|nr:hypothetical protein [Hyphomicrobiales bacterium]